MVQLARVSPFNPDHADLVHDIVYDFYGKRIATCSSDQKVKVWQIHDEEGWVLDDAWKAHDCSIVAVSWAHPEFGNVLASCSYDRSVKIWEEQEHEALGSGRRWKLRATLTESKGSVQSVEFAPNHLGLKLATCSTDGYVRIYEAEDIMNLSNWSLTGEFEAVSACKETDRLCLSWCRSRFQPQQIVVGCGDKNIARIYRLTANNQWTAFEYLGPHHDTITDVSWAPNMGRSYQLIATASKDGHVRIFKLKWEDLSVGDGELQPERSVGVLKGKWKVDLLASFPDHNGIVWRVDWNLLGTVLSSSGEDGKVRVWKAGFGDGEWVGTETVGAL
ncbi:UNVERIFIED_CONTAM: epoxide hydrolase, soluble (sEH) [Siphonaria sp. JEL0065]|nr:epoxide hydrolase, soluble (sEH) [Siphonaria sp. JEL0065]